MPHFIYCSIYLNDIEDFETLKNILLTKMKNYGLRESLLTVLFMRRIGLITKEKQKQAYKEQLITDMKWKAQISICDDLELFFNKHQTQEGAHDNQNVISFFTPKLTDEELKLVDEKNRKYMKTFWDRDPDVNQQDWIMSESNDKYLHCWCRRVTMRLTVNTINCNML